MPPSPPPDSSLESGSDRSWSATPTPSGNGDAGIAEIPSLWRHPWRWATRVGLANRLAVVLMALSLVAGGATYAVLTEETVRTDASSLLLLLTCDLGLMLLMGALIARRVVALWTRRRSGQAGSRLHVRLVAVFSLLAVTPAILVAIFSAVFLHVGVQAWFSERVRTAVNESLAVAQAYLHEHQQNLRADALAMANDLNQESLRLVNDPIRFNQVVTTQMLLRALNEAVVFDGSGRVLAHGGFAKAPPPEPLPVEAVEKARNGEVALLVNESDDRVRGVARLEGFFDSYLLVGRLVEPKVLAHMEAAQGAVREYAELEGQRSSLQITVTLIFVVVALLLLLAAVWLGLNFAGHLVAPISVLIGAAERVRAGDLAARVPEKGHDDELAGLSRAFNRMTNQLETQRSELVEANRQLDRRRRFTEAVLAGVSAGVLGLDAEGRVHLPNLSAARLLGLDEPQALVGQSLEAVAPEMADLLAEVRRRGGRPAPARQVELRRLGHPPRMLFVRMVAEVSNPDSAGTVEIRGFVVTFDDISELVSAQRKAAWADVARRIAHEIKNPLTPIQLSAERLRRRYLKEINSDPETFQICVETIIRQVDDIGRMVDEFSAFARMPGPVMKPVDLADLCRRAIFLQSNAHPDIGFSAELPETVEKVVCDGRQMTQALTNLLQNALDAIAGREPPAEGEAPLPAGTVALELLPAADRLTLRVSDNGRGLPAEDRHRLTEPYVTTRAKGTGLGLAIVRKIMEDHGGLLSLEDRAGSGACVSLVLPRGLRPAEPGEGEGKTPAYDDSRPDTLPDSRTGSRTGSGFTLTSDSDANQETSENQAAAGTQGFPAATGSPGEAGGTHGA